MWNQGNEIMPTVQGDGDGRAYDVGSEADEVSSHHSALRPFRTNGQRQVVHLEKRGPAFSDTALVDGLVQSLQSQSLKAAGEVLNALQRRCLLDVCRAWPRLLTMAGVRSRGARRDPRQAWAWAWDDMKEAVEFALCYAEQPESLVWQDADALLRSYALHAAHAAESQAGNGDHYLFLAHNAAIYRAFAEGRA